MMKLNFKHKKSVKWGEALLAFVMAFGVTFGALGAKPTSALEGDTWTVTDQFSGLSITIVSVDQNGIELIPDWSPYIYNNNTNEFGDYYFKTATSNDTLRVSVMVDGMEEGKSYRIFDDEELTSEDNGRVVIGEQKPHLYGYSMSDGVDCWMEEDGRHCSYTPLANEYVIDVMLRTSNWSDMVSKDLVVRPTAVGSQNIEIVSVQQNGEDLYLDTVGRQVTTWEDLQSTPQTINEYRIDDYNTPIEVTLKFKNLVVGDHYSYNIGEEYGSFNAEGTEETLTRELNLNFAEKHVNTTIYLYGSDYNSNENVTLYFRVADENFVPLGDIVVYEISQGGTKVEPEADTTGYSREYTFSVNDVQPIVVNLHATSATPEMTYYISYSGYGGGTYIHSEEPLAATGFALENDGVDLVIPSGYGLSEDSPISLNFYVNTTGSSYGYGSQTVIYVNYGENHNSDSFILDFYEDAELPRYGARIGYTNSDEEIYDVINAKFHDENNPLWIRIEGERYDEETTYDINAKVATEEGEFYTTTFSATGAELNAGKTFVVDGLVLSLPDFDPDATTSGYDRYYDFSLEINGLTQNGTLYYMYDGYLYAIMTYPGGKVASSTAGADMGGMYMTSSEITVRRSSIDGERAAVLRYLARGFDEDLSYDYALYYNSNAGDNWWSASAGEKVDEGVVTGAELNHDGFSINVEVPENASESSMYSLVITRNGGLVTVSKDFIRFTDAPMIESFAFHADSDSFMQTGRQDYRLARGASATATLTGIGFEDEQEYRVWVNYSGYHNEEDEFGGPGYPVDLDELNNDVVVTGAQLNAGYDYELVYDQAMDDTDNVEVIFNISDKDHVKPDPYDWGDEGVYAGHAIYIDYVEEEDVFHGGGFQIDEETSEIIDVSQPDEPEEPSVKPDQVVTFKDSDNNPITEITKFYGDEDFTITKEVTTGDGEITEYHPDDDGTGTIAHTVPGGDYVGVGEPGDVDICAWVEETDNYAATRVCYTVHVVKRPLDINGVTIAPKTYNGLTDATVTNVSFEDRGLNNDEYEATAEFDDANAGENRALHVTVNLSEGASEHYILNASSYNTTATIAPYHLIRDNITLTGGETYGYEIDGVEPEVRVEANTHGGISTLVEGQDYEVAYSNNTNVTNEAHVIVTGINNYTTGDVPVVIDFAIEAKGINNSNLIAPSSLVEGHILTTDEITINVDGHDLVQCASVDDTNCDYTLDIQGENDGVVGHSVHIAVNARGNYDGVASADIEIVAKLPQAVSFGEVTDTTVNKTFGDQDFRFEATSDGGGAITYRSSNEDVATVDENGVVSIVGVGEVEITATASATDTYAEGSASYAIAVAKKTISLTGATVETKTYDGATSATVSGATLNDSALTFGTDYSVDEAYFPSAAAGSYSNVYVKIVLSSAMASKYQFDNSGATSATINASATIVPFGLLSSNSAAVLDVTEYSYTGDALKPGATVTVDLDGDNVKETTLIADTDYMISYNNNVNVGTATATIVGQGNYSWTISGLQFTITPALVTNVVVTAPSQSYTGEALEPVPTVTGVVNGNNITFISEDYEVLAHGNFISAGNYEFSVCSSDSSNYNIPATIGTFTITRATSEAPAEVSADLKIEAGKTLAELGERTDGFSWVDSTTEVSAGAHNYVATYTKNNDTENYTTESVTVLVYGLKRINVTTVQMDGGEATGPGASALEGDQLTFTFVPNEGYELRTVTMNSVDRTNDVSNGKLVVTAGTDDIMVIAYFRRVYEVISGAGQSHIVGVDGEAEFEINAEYELFEDGGEVYVDGKLVSENNYDSWSNSTVIRFTADYMNSLAKGEHKLEVRFSDGGIARTTFTIAELEDNPAAADTGVFTGVASGAVATGLSAVVAVTLIGVVIRATRKNKKD